MEYEYNVVGFKAEIKAREARSSVGAEKVSVQLSAVLEEYSREGWELQGQYRFGVDVKPGCISGLFGASTDRLDIEQLVFRRPK